MRRGLFELQGSAVGGAMAEILTVLESTQTWATAADGVLSLADLVAALDTSTPSEERISTAEEAIQRLISRRSVARWIPRYTGLASNEYQNEFYPAYRDHSIHMLSVYLLGLYLYETVGIIRETLDSRLDPSAPSPTVTFVEWWTLASFWHDTGYPFESTGFVGDTAVRTVQLRRLSEAFAQSPFALGFKASGSSPDAVPRLVYQAGGYYPVHFTSTEDIMCSAFGEDTLDQMWRRLGVGGNEKSVPRALDRITTQVPVGRPPFHDHGTWSAMLLTFWYDEAERFLLKLGTSDESIAGIEVYKKLAESAWDDVAGLKHLVGSAAEAIGFHNIQWSSLDPNERSRILPAGKPPVVGFSTEPHLAFLALVDTLQDWDRHHFVPSRGQYRPATRACDMLLQGTGNLIRVSIKDEPNPAEKVTRLFQGWLDVEKLFAGQAKYTFPDRILSTSKATIADESSSAALRERLEGTLRNAIEAARRQLISARPDSVVNAAAGLESAQRRIREGSLSLTKSDLEQLNTTISASGLRQTENMAFALIGPGTRLSLGSVTKEIGAGGFGTVYLVKGESAGGAIREYAFKLFHARDLDLQEKRRLFHRGYQAMQALAGNRHVVQVHQFSELPVGFYMDFVPSVDLEQLRGDRLQTVAERLGLLKTIAKTLAFAHSRGVLHRDIKPGNVLLDSTGQPVLTDFDLAWMDGRTQDTKVQYATANYGAPEQFEDRMSKWRIAPTVDVYGMGALAYFVLSYQKPPFHGRWTDDTWRALHERLVSELPVAVVSKVVQMLQVCTEFDPRRRNIDMEEIVECLGRACAECASADSALSQDAWLAQVKYYVADASVDPRQKAVDSATGGTTWFFDSFRETPAGVALVVKCQLNREPAYQGVNYAGFSKASVRQVDGKLRQFEQRNRGCTIERHGQLMGAGSTMTLQVRNVPRTKVGATVLGNLMASITRALE